MQSSHHLNKENNLADQSYWDGAYAEYHLEKLQEEDVIRKWIEKYIPSVSAKTCIEIGCFPGRYITVFGDLGYELNGIDLTPRVEQEFPNWLKANGYRTGVFKRVDFFNFEPENKFDLVSSFGFIEHFKNWEIVFKKHLEWVAEDGYVVIETPNFRGWFQRAIHLILDYKNYKRHYIPSMKPHKWAEMAQAEGFEIIFQGYIGHFEFWIDEQPKAYVRRKLFNRLLTYYERLKRMKPGKKAYSPYCGIIAKRIRK